MGEIKRKMTRSGRAFGIDNVARMTRFGKYGVMLLLLIFAMFVCPIVDKNEDAFSAIDPDFYTLTASVSPVVSFEITPSKDGSLAITKDVITTSTNSPAGYKLYVSMDKNLGGDVYLNGIADDTNKFVATTGSYESPRALADNTWGYAVAGLNNFDDTYNVNNPVAIAKFASVPTYENGQLIRDYNGVASEDITEVYYGVNANYNIASGAYETEILYTVISEFSDSTSGKIVVTPNEFEFGHKNEAVTIKTSFAGTRDINNINVTIGGKNCGNINVTSLAPLTVTCQVPQELGIGKHNVVVELPDFGKSYNLENGLEILKTCEYTEGQSWNFAYTGKEAVFDAQCSGTYKLEVWGAQGGGPSTTYYGGYGGYSVGSVSLNGDKRLYINVGGAGKSVSSTDDASIAGGYNGGGAGYNSSAEGSSRGSGGGATHIAMRSGLLSTLVSSRDDILIVAGGGGGAGQYDGYSQTGIGGAGGGSAGGDGTDINGKSGSIIGNGGTQFAGGFGSAAGSFGVGGNANRTMNSYNHGGSGGGGGFYGGGASFNNVGAGGGSGYIGNSMLFNKAMYCYNCNVANNTMSKTISVTTKSSSAVANRAKTGDGYAKITYVSADMRDGDTVSVGDAWDFAYNGNVMNFIAPVAGVYKLETWGAQGGSSSTTYHGGYGAYAVGEVSLTKDATLYVVVGGAGKNATSTDDASIAGGYNGGGVGYNSSFELSDRSSGGGATHIATRTGTLSSLSSYLSSILIVSAGGGGSGSYNSDAETGIAGSGGGIVGVSSTSKGSNAGTIGTGGSQTAGGTGNVAGSFGAGGNAKRNNGSNTYGGSGGGGGLYGGGASFNNVGGGGGSSYIGNPALSNKAMYCYGCTTSSAVDTLTYKVTATSSQALEQTAKIGDGYARITLLSF